MALDTTTQKMEVTPERFEYIKKKLQYTSPAGMEADGICSVSTAYRVMGCDTYEQYVAKNKERLERYRVTNGSASSFTKVEPNKAYSRAISSTTNTRGESIADINYQYNKRLKVKTHGVSQYRYVDESILSFKRKNNAIVFGAPIVAALCQMAEGGALHTTMIQYLMEHGYARMGMEQVMMALSFNEGNLAQFQEAYERGNGERARKRMDAFVRSGKTRRGKPHAKSGASKPKTSSTATKKTTVPKLKEPTTTSYVAYKLNEPPKIDEKPVEKIVELQPIKRNPINRFMSKANPLFAAALLGAEATLFVQRIVTGVTLGLEAAMMPAVVWAVVNSLGYMVSGIYSAIKERKD